MDITYLGHAAFLITIGDYRLVFDPFIQNNPKNEGQIELNQIEADYVLLTHAHQDHTEDAEFICKNTGATLIANYEIVTYYQKKGVNPCYAMNIGGAAHFEFGTVIMTHALHSSSFSDGTYGGVAAGYIIQSEDKNFYFAGDTAPFYEMRLYAEKTNFHFAILPIGGTYTMDTAQAMIAADFLNVKNIIGMHFDTWPEIAIDHAEVEYIAAANEKKILLPQIGEKITF